MPITTAPRRRPRSARGFTLVELLVSTGLSAIILVGVLGAVLMITRNGYLLHNYIDMEKQARLALETFAVDARIAESVVWQRASDTAPLTGLTLINPDGGRATYTYDPAAGTLVRSTPSGATTTLISGIQSFSFTAYKYSDVHGLATIAPASRTLADLARETKMVQLSLSAIRRRSSLIDATNNVVSARFVLRNRIIVN
jgi:Tfp pilus assembly protein PilW